MLSPWLGTCRCNSIGLDDASSSLCSARTALAWPFEARAQQSAMPVVGFLNSTSLTTASNHLSGFRQGLQQAGYVEGRNLAVEYRWAEGDTIAYQHLLQISSAVVLT